jgi:hypothetical protein
MASGASAAIFSICNTMFDAVVFPAWPYGVVGSSMRKICWETLARKPPDLLPGVGAKPHRNRLNDEYSPRSEWLSSRQPASFALGLFCEINALAKSGIKHPKPAAIYLSALPEIPAPKSCKPSPGDEDCGKEGPGLSQGIAAQCMARSSNCVSTSWKAAMLPASCRSRIAASPACTTRARAFEIKTMVTGCVPSLPALVLIRAKSLQSSSANACPSILWPPSRQFLPLLPSRRDSRTTISPQAQMQLRLAPPASKASLDRMRLAISALTLSARCLLLAAAR